MRRTCIFAVSIPMLLPIPISVEAASCSLPTPEVVYGKSYVDVTVVNECGFDLTISFPVTFPDGRVETRKMRPTRCGGRDGYQGSASWRVGNFAYEYNDAQATICGSISKGGNAVDKSGLPTGAKPPTATLPTNDNKMATLLRAARQDADEASKRLKREVDDLYAGNQSAMSSLADAKLAAEREQLERDKELDRQRRASEAQKLYQESPPSILPFVITSSALFHCSTDMDPLYRQCVEGPPCVTIDETNGSHACALQCMQSLVDNKSLPVEVVACFAKWTGRPLE
ncbi:hypothetical protein [Rhizobium leguminosarum]|uniref:hypothetical protein n=1 Tax=Rhizobium leguminosarum TaxID=384 RepID=UPI0014423ACE|nr:hypothetical protein [Rhizobium leguminosarum]NKM92317.1 hypothetical protein [Rhizobium leguminosarum bv. viciae]